MGGTVAALSIIGIKFDRHLWAFAMGASALRPSAGAEDQLCTPDLRWVQEEGLRPLLLVFQYLGAESWTQVRGSSIRWACVVHESFNLSIELAQSVVFVAPPGGFVSDPFAGFW